MLKQIAILAGLLIGAQSQAAFLDDPKWRVGIGAGQFKVEADDIDLSDKSIGWEVFGGYEFNRYLAIEAGYIDGGKFHDNIGGVNVSADANGFYGTALASLPIGDSASVYARAGLLHWESDEKASFQGASASEKVDGDDLIYGAGVAATVEGALLRLEYRFADLGDTDLSAISLALAWRF